jgi:hypothetical protein
MLGALYFVVGAEDEGDEVSFCLPNPLCDGI